MIMIVRVKTILSHSWRQVRLRENAAAVCASGLLSQSSSLQSQPSGLLPPGFHPLEGTSRQHHSGQEHVQTCSWQRVAGVRGGGQGDNRASERVANTAAVIRPLPSPDVGRTGTEKATQGQKLAELTTGWDGHTRASHPSTWAEQLSPGVGTRRQQHAFRGQRRWTMGRGWKTHKALGGQRRGVRATMTADRAATAGRRA